MALFTIPLSAHAQSASDAKPSLEVYGHHCDDPAKSETTILIGLRAKSA